MRKFCPFFICVLALFTACNSQPEVTEPEPLWMTTNPEDSNAYYIGISGSNTGDQAADKEAAYQKAVNALASTISIAIQSSTSTSETESDGDSTFSYANNIESQVSQNLEDIETADSYYSPGKGYWFYLRLSKDRWEELVKQRAENLKDQLSDMFFETFRDSYAELKTIDRAMAAYYKAYSGSPIKMELFDLRGSVDNILILRADKLLSEMTIQWESLPETIQQGDVINLKGQITLSGEEESPGSYKNAGPLPLILLNAEDEVLLHFEAQPDGSFDIQYQESGKPGQEQYRITLEAPFRADGLGSQMDYRFPKTSQQMEITSLNLTFKLESNWKNYGQYESVFQTLENLTDITLVSESNTSGDKFLKADLSYRLGPPNDFGMIFSYVKIFLSKGSGSEETVIWESDEIKGAGLTEEQAKQKSFDSLMEKLREQQELSTLLNSF